MYYVKYILFMSICTDCNLEPETGPCKGLLPRFFFNSTSGFCERFTYGGCGGNDNNFITHLACYGRCHEGVIFIFYLHIYHM